MESPKCGFKALPAPREGLTVIESAAVFTPFERFESARILIKDGVVEAVGQASEIAIPPNSDVIQLPDSTLVPGFIDAHIHGASGTDVMEGTYDALNTVSRAVAASGVTAFLPTTVSAPAAALGSTVERLGALIATRQFEGAQPVGIHLEGPFINAAKRGAHPASHLLAPTAENVVLLGEWVRRSGRTIRIVTFAPELDGAEGIIREAATGGFTLAMGHSNASAKEAAKAADDGVHYAAHTFNAMRAFTHREPGIVGAVLTDDRVYAEIIADGIHVAPPSVCVFARCKRRERFLLVTDATSACGMPDGTYTLGGEKLHVADGVCRNAEGHLAGSTLQLDVALRNYLRWTGATLQDALFGVTANPAQALGLEGRGAIAPGARADLVALNNDNVVTATIIGGRLVKRMPPTG